MKHLPFLLRLYSSSTLAQRGEPLQTPKARDCGVDKDGECED